VTKKGVIKELKGETVVLATFADEACTKCNMCGSCVDMEVPRESFNWDCGAGDRVIVEVVTDYKKLVFLIYLLPVIFLIAGYFTGKLIFPGGEIPGMIFAALFFFIAFPVIRISSAGLSRRTEIIITKDGGTL